MRWFSAAICALALGIGRSATGGHRGKHRDGLQLRAQRLLVGARAVLHGDRLYRPARPRCRAPDRPCPVSPLYQITVLAGRAGHQRGRGAERRRADAHAAADRRNCCRPGSPTPRPSDRWRDPSIDVVSAAFRLAAVAAGVGADREAVGRQRRRRRRRQHDVLGGAVGHLEGELDLIAGDRDWSRRDRPTSICARRAGGAVIGCVDRLRAGAPSIVVERR